jgi:class 3 adenylate cyclase
MANFSRLITYDQRGVGYSDPINAGALPDIDELVEDLEAVIKAAGVTDPILFGSHNGGAVAAAYAVGHKVSKLILCNTWARLSRADDYPFGFSERVLDALEERYRKDWGSGSIYEMYGARKEDGGVRPIELEAASRNQVVPIFKMNRSYDIRHLLPSIDTPTLVMHLDDNVVIPPVFGQYVAESIPNAQFMLISGTDQVWLRNFADPVIDEVEQVVTGSRSRFEDAVVTTMMFTDIVDSTALAASMSNDAWSVLIERHNLLVRQHIFANLGDEAKCTGDGFLVTFDEPALAIRCALGAMKSVESIGLKLRAGVHVGEVTRMGRSDLAGVEVHFTQRVSALAEADQVLISDAARQAVDDSELKISPWGSTALKGIPGEWEIFEARL